MRLIGLLLYGSGLRLNECLSLRVKDVDFDRREIMVRSGKGDTDRRVPLPNVARSPLKAHLLEGGKDIRTIQELLGHTDVQTTMIYTHVLNSGAGVVSPADHLPALDG